MFYTERINAVALAFFVKFAENYSITRMKTKL